MIERLKRPLIAVLRWSERYTKTDMVYLASGGFWLGLGQAVSSLSALALAVAFANLLPVEMFGAYRYVLSIAALIGVATLQGMGTAVARSVSQGNEGALKPALVSRIKWGLLGSLGSLIIAAYYLFNENYTLAASFCIVSIFLPLLDSFFIYNAYLQGKKEFAPATKYNALSHVTATISLITVLYFTNNILILLLTYFGIWTACRVLFFFRTVKRYPPNDSLDVQTISYGKHLSAMGVLGTIAGSIDKILLWHFFGPIQVALYFFAISAPTQIRAVVQNISPLAFAKFAKRDLKDLKYGLLQKMFILLLVTLPIVLGYIIVAPFIFKVFFPQYLDAVFYSQIFSLVLLLQPGMLLGVALAAHAKTKELYIANTINPLIHISLFVALAPFYGILGIIFAKLIAETLHFLLNLYLVFWFRSRIE